MIAMAAPAGTAQFAALADELYEQLPDELIYVAENWEQELLVALGYERRDQSDIAHALRLLVGQGRITKSSVRRGGGYHASRRRDYPRPRKVTITKIT